MTDAWQPIATAPKDGTKVLTFGSVHEMDGIEEPTFQISWFLERGGWYCDAWGGHEPHLWMPLPTSPEGAADA